MRCLEKMLKEGKNAIAIGSAICTLSGPIAVNVPKAITYTGTAVSATALATLASSCGDTPLGPTNEIITNNYTPPSNELEMLNDASDELITPIPAVDKKYTISTNNVTINVRLAYYFSTPEGGTVLTSSNKTLAVADMELMTELEYNALLEQATDLQIVKFPRKNSDESFETRKQNLKTLVSNSYTSLGCYKTDY